VREPDGLALSSRNALLTPNHRRRAVALVRALLEASRHEGVEEAERAARRVLLAMRISPEYFVIRDAATLSAPRPGHPCRALVAARVGTVRLIDNAPWPGFTIPS
jgi:pantoate--beta-alanine ligase